VATSPLQLHPYPHPLPLMWRVSILVCGGRVLEIINHAKFQLDRFRVSETQVAENRYLPLTGCITLTTVYTLTCYAVISVVEPMSVCDWLQLNAPQRVSGRLVPYDRAMRRMRRMRIAFRQVAPPPSQRQSIREYDLMCL